MISQTFTIQEIKQPFNFDLTARRGTFFPPRSFERAFFSDLIYTSSGKLVKLDLVSNENDAVRVLTHCEASLSRQELSEIKDWISFCFGLGEDLNDFYPLASEDRYLNIAIKDLRGMRVCGNSLFRGCIIITSSQNTSIVQARNTIEKFVKAFGEPLTINETTHFSFPKPESISKVTLKALKSCGFGYRAQYIKNIIFEVPKIEKSIKKSEPHEIKNQLLKIKGIGQYTTEALGISVLRDYSSFFVDSLVRKVFAKMYLKDDVKDSEILKISEEMWEGYRGLALWYLLADLNNISRKFNLNLENKLGE